MYTIGMIWGLVWGVFALFIIWMFARSIRTVRAQQTAWAAFAKKHNLFYQAQDWYKAPMVEGEIKERPVRIYVEETVEPNRRMREFRTTTEVFFNGQFPTGFAIASRAYHEQIRAIEGISPFRLPSDPAFVGLLAMARNPEMMGDILTPARLDALRRLFSVPRAERLIMGHETETYMVIQGADSLETTKDLNARMHEMFAIADALQMQPPESKDEVTEEARDDHPPE